MPSMTANDKGFSLRTDRWRYMNYHNGEQELYDHDHDPMEWHNLAERTEHREIRNRLKSFLPEHAAPVRSHPRNPDSKNHKPRNEKE